MFWTPVDSIKYASTIKNMQMAERVNQICDRK